MAEFQYAGSISHGTMRTEDLLPKFLEVLQNLNKNAYEKLVGGLDLNAETNWERFVACTPVGADEILESLFDMLDMEAPEGYYFGAHPGDGSDYGFWETTDG